MAVWAIVLLAAGAGTLVVWLLWRRGGRREDAEQASRLDRLLTETSAARQASESLDRRFEELRRSVEQRVGGVERTLTDGQKRMDDRLDSSGKLWKEFGEAIGRLFEAVQKTEKLASDVTRLEDLLKPPKLRGALGEAFLEQALAQALPPGSWQMQYRFPDGEIVDAAIRVGDRFVPVDSKFPLDNFRRAREAEDPSERKRALRVFAADVRRHAETIAGRYIRPAGGTYDFALMYVPAEAVYCEIADGEDGLADYAVARRVIPVSPRLLYAYLSTVALGLRGMQLEQNAREIQDRIADLSRRWRDVDDPFSTLGRHLGNALNKYQETSRAFERFAARLDGVAERADQELEGEQTAGLPPLPPS